ncbi:MAG: hypothetical protein ACXVHR_09250 [Methanobacterium sp.]
MVDCGITTTVIAKARIMIIAMAKWLSYASFYSTQILFGSSLSLFY